MDERELNAFKEAKEAKDAAKGSLTDEEKELYRKMLEAAKMPTVLKDSQVVCGPGELDIRKLNRANRDQMIYRALMLDLVNLKAAVDGLTDIMRLMMVMLKKQGVGNISEAIEEAMNEVIKEAKR